MKVEYPSKATNLSQVTDTYFTLRCIVNTLSWDRNLANILKKKNHCIERCKCNYYKIMRN